MSTENLGQKEVTDCGGDGCGECEVCQRLDFTEWARCVGGSIPHTIEANDRVDSYILDKYGFKP